MKLRVLLSAAVCGLLLATPALAAGPVGLLTSFERIETVSYTSTTTTLAGAEQTVSSWRLGLGTSPGNGYSIPRVGLEYAFESGLSVGLAAGVMLSFKERIGPDATLLEPRVGYSFLVSDDFLVWPRLGVTFHDLNDPDASYTALSLDVPVMVFDDSFGAMTVGPFLDLGLAGSAGDADLNMTEFGLAVGIQLF